VGRDVGINGSNGDAVTLIERLTAMIWPFHKKYDKL
jgi:hypothetical protein